MTATAVRAAQTAPATQVSPAGPSPAEPTATGPTVRSVGRRWRGPLFAALALVVVAVALSALRAGQSGALDPDSYDPSGSRAVAELLRAGGVRVDRVDTVEAVLAMDGARTVVVLPRPEALAPGELDRLASLRAAVVVVAPDDAALSALRLPAVTALPVEIATRRAACDLPVALRAGDATLGGFTYQVTGNRAATGCFAGSGRAALLQLPERPATLLGTGAPLTNASLGTDGNAALALGLLGSGDRVAWLMPRPGRPVPTDGVRPLGELVPAAVQLGGLQLAVAAGVLALARGRRLGRVVEEPLPVVVRAAESVEGRSRLYRAAGARSRAAEALRAGTRARLVGRLGLPAGADRPALVATAAVRSGRDPAALDALLYGAAPGDDVSLVRLADDLRSLERALL